MMLRDHLLKTVLLVGFSVILIPAFVRAQRPGKTGLSQGVLLPNGWMLTPSGSSLALGDLPLNMQLSHSGKLLAVTNNGQSTQSIQLIDPVREQQLDEKTVSRSWYGLAFNDKDDTLFASGGNDNCILAFPIFKKKLGTPGIISLGKPWPDERICPTGLAVDSRRGLLYAVTKEDSALYIVNAGQARVTQRIALGSEAYACILSPDGATLCISIWGDKKVVLFDTRSQKKVAVIAVGDHPNELVMNRAGTILFVANSLDNSVSVIDLPARKVITVLSASLYPTQLSGSTTNGLALSKDEQTLYVANADNNCLVVFDVSEPKSAHSKGFIPVGWYPTNVKTLGRRILVANGKGFSSLPNPLGPQPASKTDNSGYQKGIVDKKKVQYIGGLFKGTLSFIPSPDLELLRKYTRQVYQNSPFKGDSSGMRPPAGNALFPSAKSASPIHHVFYVIKENRTYDQILGDMPNGAGDTALCLFPRRVTPNEHALADEFVLLDNFFVDAEVSADGHNWSTAAYANDFVEKTWPTSYGGRGGDYDYEGSRKIAYPRKGFIWDYCRRAGVSYRSYGEFAGDGQTYLESLEGHLCNASPGFDMDITDVHREEVWAHDFDSLLAAGAVPQLSTIRLSNDHTSGQRKGKISPTAAMADNDLAVGRLVEHLSHSPIWTESVVIIVEDDAQNGPDHIDAHRSTVYLAGAYIKRHAVLSKMWGTSSVLHTIEMILGLPPMSQYDVAAPPMWECFQDKPDATPFSARPANVDLSERNVAVNESSRASESFDLSREDAAPDLLLNEVVWKSVKGERSQMPPCVHSAFVFPENREKGDD